MREPIVDTLIVNGGRQAPLDEFNVVAFVETVHRWWSSHLSESFEVQSDMPPHQAAIINREFERLGIPATIIELT